MGKTGQAAHCLPGGKATAVTGLAAGSDHVLFAPSPIASQVH